MTVPTKTMAVRLFEYGGPEKLIYAEYDLPPLGTYDVLVKNFAGSVSRWDVKYRAGDLTRYQIPGRAPFPLPQQLGREAAGEVIAVGSAVSRFKPGDARCRCNSSRGSEFDRDRTRARQSVA